VSSVSTSRTASSLPARRTDHVVLPGRVLVERRALHLEVEVVGQPDRQLVLGDGTSPQDGQWIIGTGGPQERCRETSQSRSR
jgi:hypothetical protein